VLRRIDGVVYPCTQEGVNPFEKKCRETELINNVPIIEEMDISNGSERGEEFSACYVGAMRQDRGLVQCVEACNKANIRLITAGGVTENNFIEKLKIIDRNNMLEYRGVISHDAVVDVLKSCNVGLVTELNVGQNHMFDNLPTKTYEYMIMGLPVIISNYKYANELISKYQFGISVNPEDVEEIAKALEFIRDNPEEAKRMGAQGKKLILEKLNWKIEEKKLEDFYLRVLKG
jgi:glycosyltransferase involved in cell wall biosynthesis